MRRDTSFVFMSAVRHQYQGGNKMNDRKEIPRELLEKILADTHTDSPRLTFMSQGMGSVLGLWQCSCGFMASGNFCTECGTRKPWECPMCKALNIGEKCGRCGLSEPSAK